ncbi:hypothetical protein K7432_002207, partial [Basidiobolus ranarum]
DGKDGKDGKDAALFANNQQIQEDSNEHTRLVARAEIPYRRPKYGKGNDGPKLQQADDGSFCEEPIAIPIPSIMQVITICV